MSMLEKGITVYVNKELKALVIVNEIDLGFIDKKIVAYVDKDLKEVIINVLSLFKETQVNISELQEKLLYGFKNAYSDRFTVITTTFDLESNIKNKTVRNRRMLEKENLTSENYVKVVKHIGIEKTKYIRKR